MKKITLVSGFFAVALLAGAGCGSSGDGAGAKSVGVNAAGNEKELVALVPELKQCKFVETFGVGGYDKCPAYKKIKEQSPKLPNGFATLINFLEDSEAVVRYAASHALTVSFYTGGPLTPFVKESDAARVYAALNKETFIVTAKAMSGIIGKFAVQLPSTRERAAAFITSNANNTKVRAEFLNYYFSSDLLKDANIFAAVSGAAINETEDMEVRQSALSQLKYATPEVKAQARVVVEKLTKSPDATIASAALSALEKLNK